MGKISKWLDRPRIPTTCHPLELVTCHAASEALGVGFHARPEVGAIADT